MKRVAIVLMLLATGVAASAQNYKVDLEKLGSTLRDKGLVINGYLYDDMFVVRQDSLCGIMNMKGEMLLPMEYSTLFPLRGSRLLYVMNAGDTLGGILDASLKRIIWGVTYPKEISDSYEKSDFPLILCDPNGKWGAIDSLGNWIVPLEIESRYHAIIDEKLCGIIQDNSIYNYRQKKVVMKNVMFCGKLGENRYLGFEGKDYRKIGIFDTLGHWVVEPKYSYMGYPGENGLLPMRVGKEWGYIDTLGREVIGFKYALANGFNDGLAAVKSGDLWGYVDMQGNEVIPLKYYEANSFVNGRAVVQVNEGPKYAVIDRDGKVLLMTTDSSRIHAILNNSVLWCVSAKGGGLDWFVCRYVLTDFKGKVLEEYDDLIFPEGGQYWEDLFPVRKGNKWGLVDNEYNLVVPCKYRQAEANYESSGAIVALDDGTTQYVSRKGRPLLKLDGLWQVVQVKKNLYSVMVYDTANWKCGFADTKGHSTFSREELATARAVYLKRLEELESVYNDDEIWEEFSERVSDKDEEPSQAEVVADPVAVDERLEDVSVFVENDAQFPGGMDSLLAFLRRNVVYPEQARKEGIEGNVFVQFVVEKDGSLNNIKVLRDIGGDCAQEAVRVVKMMPKWEPARQRGNVVRCQFILPVKFKLAKEEPDEK